MQEYRLLLVDDEKDILKLLQYNFELEGMNVHTAQTGKDAIDLALSLIPNVILLDVMLPDIDGIEVCEILRKNPVLNNTIIIFLSARGEDYSQVAGYRAGADDYIVKPIRIKVLLHKIKALLDRNRDYNDFESINNMQIDSDRFSIMKDGKESIIPKKEFELLSYLMSSPDKVFRREEILSEVWGDAFIGDRTIDVHVRKLREKFGREIIRTVKGVGYRFMGN
ncbi:response regulator transcription factor [Crocinitomix catalasitica]|uniref:response regulator transcription factor n=1 Tax=Crocinitomix catalasitica TaxID=184607 RepID=UPI000487AEEF|nr:response regulator transcription factor [Crocinitomix catalasitica]